MPEVEYDLEKHLRNIEERGLGFDIAAEIFEGLVLEWPDERFDYGEDRFIALGMVDGRVLVVVYTWRGERRRIISARKADKDERETYGKALARYGPDGPD
jgi:uncharacterized protein